MKCFLAMITKSLSPVTEKKITALAVSMEYRKNGIGTKLLNLVENYCRSNNIGLVSLNSGLPREGAHLFYESKGYIKKSYGFVKQIE